MVGILGVGFWGWDFGAGILRRDFGVGILGMEFFLEFWLHALQVPGSLPPKKSQKFPAPGPAAPFDPGPFPRDNPVVSGLQCGISMECGAVWDGSHLRARLLSSQKISGNGTWRSLQHSRGLHNSQEVPEFPGSSGIPGSPKYSRG